jgi:hypothetical protein
VRALAGGLGLFAAVFALHLALWRIRVPRPGRRFLGVLFLAALPMAAMTAFLVRGWGPAAGLVPTNAPEVLLFAALYLAASLAYLALYVALEGGSPTLALTDLIRRSEPGGIAPETLREAIGFERHLRARLALMVADGMTEVAGGRHRITAKGRRLLRYYDIYGRIAGLTGKSI